MTVAVTAERTRTAQQQRRPDHLPEEVIEHFLSVELQVRWGSRDETQQGMDQTLGYTPVLFDELPKDVQTLARRHFILQPDQTLTRGDMILQVRTFAEARAQMATEDEIRTIQESPDSQLEAFAADVNAVVGSNKFSSGNVVDRARSHVPAVRDNVVGGPDALAAGAVNPDVRSAVEEILKEKRRESYGPLGGVEPTRKPQEE